jgi:hypothetical protein
MFNKLAKNRAKTIEQTPTPQGLAYSPHRAKPTHDKRTTKTKLKTPLHKHHMISHPFLREDDVIVMGGANMRSSNIDKKTTLLGVALTRCL